MNKPYQEWCAAHAWAVTTEAECNGYPPPDDPRYPTTYALYDAAEDDPPIALFEFREDAERVAAILNEYGRDIEPSRGVNDMPAMPPSGHDGSLDG